MCQPNLAYAELSELEQYDLMLTWMIITYFACLAFGWGLLASDYLVVTIEKKQQTEPWISDAVIIGGASAVLSPIIQWSNTIIQTRNTASQSSSILPCDQNHAISRELLKNTTLWWC